MNLDLLCETFSALGESLRLRIACCLSAADGGLCVCEIVDAVDAPQPNVSRHLKLMKSAGLVREHREGRWIYYRLVDEHPLAGAIRQCLTQACCSTELHDTLARLDRRLAMREGGKCVVGMTARALQPERR